MNVGGESVFVVVKVGEKDEFLIKIGVVVIQSNGFDVFVVVFEEEVCIVEIEVFVIVVGKKFFVLVFFGGDVEVELVVVGVLVVQVELIGIIDVRCIIWVFWDGLEIVCFFEKMGLVQV